MPAHAVSKPLVTQHTSPITQPRPATLPPAHALLAVLVGLGVLLRLADLDGQSFWYDEAASVELARASPWDLLTGRARDRGNPPLFPLLLHGWTRLGFTADAGVRALPALFGLLCLPLVYALGRRLVGRTCAIVATGMFAVAPMHVQLAQETRAYTLLTFAGLLSTFALVRALAPDHRPTRRWGDLARARWWGLHALATCAMLYTHYFGVFLVAAHLVTVIARGWRDVALLARAAASFTVVAAGWLPWLPTFIAQLTEDGNLSRSAESWHLHALATPLVFGGGWTVLWKGLVGPARLGLALATVVALGASIFAGVASLRGRRARLVLLPWLLVPLLGPIVWSLIAGPLYNSRYVVLAALPACLLSAAGLVAMSPGRRLGLVLCMAAGVGCAHATYFGGPVKDDWRRAALHVDAHAGPRDLTLFSPDLGESPFARYSSGPSRRLRLVDEATTTCAGPRAFATPHAGTPPRDVTRPLRTAPAVWLVRPGPPHAAIPLPAALRDHDRVGGATFRGVSIERLLPRPSTTAVPETRATPGSTSDAPATPGGSCARPSAP